MSQGSASVVVDLDAVVGPRILTTMASRSRGGFVDAVVDHFTNEMVEAVFAGARYTWRPFADRLGLFNTLMLSAL
jgi:hypothetical protein